MTCRRADKLEGEWGEVDHAFALKSMATEVATMVVLWVAMAGGMLAEEKMIILMMMMG